MSFRPPTSRDQIYEKLSADVKSNIPNSNPQKEQSWLKTLLVGMAGAFFDWYKQILEAIKTFFADTTYGIYLAQNCANYGITRNPATQALGPIVLVGTVASVIPALTPLTKDGRQYKTQNTQAITTSSLNISSLTWASGIATVVCVAEHFLANNINVLIAGSVPPDLNGTVPIVAVTGPTTFTYATSLVGSGTATGTITVTSTKAVVNLLSDGYGAIQNLSANDSLILSTPIIGVDNTAYVTYEGVGGGADEEDDDSMRERLIYRLQNPVTMFNAAQITNEAKKSTFIKRVFVFEVTPAAGQVTVYVLKDNNELPDASEISQVKARLVATILPANTAEADFIISAPTPHLINFQIGALNPNTATMQASIYNRLSEYFKRQTIVGQDIFTEDWITVIKSTIDTETGDTVVDFNMVAPVADVAIAANEIALLGTVAFV